MRNHTDEVESLFRELAKKSKGAEPAGEGLIRDGYEDLAGRLERCGVELERRGGKR